MLEEIAQSAEISRRRDNPFSSGRPFSWFQGAATRHDDSKQMSLGDAVQAVQIAKYAGAAQCLLTWNARHFQGKLTIPVLTPQEWLNQQTGTAGT